MRHKVRSSKPLEGSTPKSTPPLENESRPLSRSAAHYLCAFLTRFHDIRRLAAVPPWELEGSKYHLDSVRIQSQMKPANTTNRGFDGHRVTQRQLFLRDLADSHYPIVTYRNCYTTPLPSQYRKYSAGSDYWQIKFKVYTRMRVRKKTPGKQSPVNRFSSWPRLPRIRFSSITGLRRVSIGQ